MEAALARAWPTASIVVFVKPRVPDEATRDQVLRGTWLTAHAAILHDSDRGGHSLGVAGPDYGVREKPGDFEPHDQRGNLLSGPGCALGEGADECAAPTQSS